MDFNIHLEAILTSILLVAGTYLLERIIRTRVRNPYPPGPVARPVLGNVLPTVTPWITYTQWSKLYGPVMHLKAFTQHIIVLSSEDAATDLYEKRSHTYADRPYIPMIDLMGWSFNSGFMPYSETWRKHRRVFHQHFRPEASLAYRPTELRKVHVLLRALLQNPDDIVTHVRMLTAGIMMETMYGHDIKSMDDEYVTLVSDSVDMLSSSVFPGATVVNALPFLRHFLKWLPGVVFQSFVDKSAALTNRMLTAPYEHVKNNVATGQSQKPCLATKLLLGNEHITSDQEHVHKSVLALAYAAGGDTSVSALMTFVLAMALYPHVVAQAHAELDRVLGGKRLPTFEDRPALPYIDAIYREVMRWHPVLPLGVARAAQDDDVYNGYLIPKGT
ncbi:hypothetical protein HGRIS_006895 [Hohenbuehelia grisea]|uniref:Cytochrome P450 n=1 Tax=Hohenbuehelia grisea TaxID=104357 RepID=A0ABR3JAY8_9AGAR